MQYAEDVEIFARFLRGNYFVIVFLDESSICCEVALRQFGIVFRNIPDMFSAHRHLYINLLFSPTIFGMQCSEARTVEVYLSNSSLSLVWVVVLIKVTDQ